MNFIAKTYSAIFTVSYKFKTNQYANRVDLDKTAPI